MAAVAPRPVPAGNDDAAGFGRRGYSGRVDQAGWFCGRRWIVRGDMHASAEDVEGVIEEIPMTKAPNPDQIPDPNSQWPVEKTFLRSETSLVIGILVIDWDLAPWPLGFLHRRHFNRQALRSVPTHPVS